MSAMGKTTLDLGACEKLRIMLCTCSGDPNQTCHATDGHADVTEGLQLDEHTRQKLMDCKGLQVLESYFRGLAS